MKAIILGAGSGFLSGIDEHSHPTAIHEISNGRRTLDYLITAFQAVGVSEIIFVGGYQIERIMKLYPSLQYYYNPDWQKTGPAASLKLCSPFLTGEILICYADILHTENAMHQIMSSQKEVAILEDRTWITRYVGRGPHLLHEAEKISCNGTEVNAIGRNLGKSIHVTGQFAGLIKLKSSGTAILKKILDESAEQYHDHQFHESINFLKSGITDLIQEIIDQGNYVESIVIRDGWSELDAPQDVAQFIFGTKAETLDRLKDHLLKSTVLAQVRFTLDEWQKNHQICLKKILKKFDSRSLVIRSSALNEDNWHSSNAGQYVSFIGIDGADQDKVSTCIDDVFESYQDDNPDHQCLIQPALKNVSIAGVVFTRDPETAAPYYQISYECTGSTNGITSGTVVPTQTKTIFKHMCGKTGDQICDRLIDSFREVEDVAGYDSLDIEFAMTKDNKIYILQVRPLLANRKLQFFSDQDIEEEIRQVEQCVDIVTGHSDILLGGHSVLGVMPDWNPAEIIGRNPRPLALSLYQYLITDEIWGIQRREYGYRDTYPSPLMIGLAGQGYIDTRASFNSFIPADIPDDLARRLVDYYIAHLGTHPELHDKIEFEIVFTCFSFDFDQKSCRLTQNGFSDAEVQILRDALVRLTRNALMDADTFFKNQFDAVSKLSIRRNARRNITDLSTAFFSIRRMLEDCRRYGTLPFAHLARSAFVAMAILRSLVKVGIIGNEDYQQYLTNIETVAGKFRRDLDHFRTGNLTKNEFLKKYGHLRPGTYDILSLRYDEAPEIYFDFNTYPAGNTNDPKKLFEFSLEQKRDINKLLTLNGLGINVDQLTRFITLSIQGREDTKFEFSREISDILRLIGFIGDQLGLSRDEMSYIPIQEFANLGTHSVPSALSITLRDIIERNRAHYQITKALKLPYVINNSNEVEYFSLEPSRPNFVTHKIVTGRLFCIDHTYSGMDLKNMIVHTTNADPGFDWIFGRDIVGLLTTYGGANSHMAIRAGEFGLPAAIGCGDEMAKQWKTGMLIELNCETGQINVID